MAWVQFSKDFDWKPASNVMLAYRAGMTVLVTRRCAELAVARGVAVEVKPPSKQERHNAGHTNS